MLSVTIEFIQIVLLDPVDSLMNTLSIVSICIAKSILFRIDALILFFDSSICFGVRSSILEILYKDFFMDRYSVIQDNNWLDTSII
jgi:hypothetical protein